MDMKVFVNLRWKLNGKEKYIFTRLSDVPKLIESTRE